MEPSADDAANDARREIASLSDDLFAKPSEFGLAYLSVDDLIARAESEGVTSEQTESRSWPRWAAPLTVGLAAAATVTVALVLPRLDAAEPQPVATVAPTTSETAPHAYGSGRAVLLAASTVSGPSTQTSHYWHVKSVQRFGSEEVPREVWIGRDRPTVLRQDGFVEEIPALTFPVGPRSADWRGLQTLPTSAEQLRSLLAQDAATHGRDKRWVVFKTAGDLLAEAPVPPAVRKALWKILAAEHGARKTERTTDEVNRVGWTVSLSVSGEGRVTYVVDPVSGEMLEARHAPDGEAPWSVTYLERGPANIAPALTGA